MRETLEKLRKNLQGDSSERWSLVLELFTKIVDRLDNTNRIKNPFNPKNDPFKKFDKIFSDNDKLLNSIGKRLNARYNSLNKRATDLINKWLNEDKEESKDGGKN